MRKFAFLLIMLSVLFIVPAHAATEEAAKSAFKGLFVSTPYPSLSVAVDEPITIDISVHNAGLPPQNVELVISEAPNNWHSVFIGGGRPIRSVFVAPDAVEDVTLRLIPPEDIEKGSHRFTVTARGADERVDLPLEISFDHVLPARLTMETELPALRGTPTSSFDFDVKIKNESGREAVARLEAAAPPGFQVSFKERFGSQELTSIPIKAGESRELEVEVDPHPMVEAGTYEVAVRAVTEHGNALTTLILDIMGRADLSLTGPDERLSGTARAGEETPFTLIVANRGSAAAQGVEFSAFEPSGWNVAFDPESIDVLPAGEQREIKALVTPSSKAISGDYMVTLRANSEGASESSEFRVTVETSTLWGVVGVLVIAAAVVVLSLAVIRFGRR